MNTATARALTKSAQETVGRQARRRRSGDVESFWNVTMPGLSDAADRRRWAAGTPPRRPVPGASSAPARSTNLGRWPVERDQPADQVPEHIEVRAPEKRERQHQGHHGDGHADDHPESLGGPGAVRLERGGGPDLGLEDVPQAVHESEQQEGALCCVPEGDHLEVDQKRQPRRQGAPPPSLVAPIQRYARPPHRQGREQEHGDHPRERDVPPAIEVYDAGRPQWRVEVDRQADAEQSRDADRDVGVAGEVEYSWKK